MTNSNAPFNLNICKENTRQHNKIHIKKKRYKTDTKNPLGPSRICKISKRNKAATWRLWTFGSENAGQLDFTRAIERVGRTAALLTSNCTSL